MNLKQLKYILEIERQGSISRAAQVLFVSQPSLSNSIRELEDELGVTIFLRSQSGIKTTPEGSQICKYARSALSQLDNITKVSLNLQSTDFRISTEQYSFVMEAFIKLCLKYEQNNESLNFTILNAEMMEVINSVAKLESDLGFILINNSAQKVCTDILQAKNIDCVSIGDLSLNVNLRSNHPLLDELPFPFYKLNEYMFVKYANEKNYPLSYMPDLTTLKIINPRKIVSVNDRELKCNIVSQTNAFSIGCTLHPDFMCKFNIVSIPIPNNFASLCYIKTKNSYLSPEAISFIELLKKELVGIKQV